jgi:peptidoglycan/LPS O-acetylase OafA/YrhL
MIYVKSNGQSLGSARFLAPSTGGWHHGCRFDREGTSRITDDTDTKVLARALSAPHIGGLDFIRALAVSLVIWGHASENRFTDTPALAGLGVTIFFVLSGFLITRLLLAEYAAKGCIDLLEFYRRRVARLMPIFYLFLGIGLGILWLNSRAIPWGPVIASMLYVLNYYQAFTGAHTNLVSHCWSLAVEEQFYLLWPALMMFTLRRRWNLAKVLVAIVLAVWGWRWFVAYSDPRSADYLYRALETRADELAIGCLLAALTCCAGWRTRLAALNKVPILGLLLAACLYGITTSGSASNTFKYGWEFAAQPLLIAPLLVMIIMRSARPGLVAAAINNRLIVHIGQISYCMYLFHGLIGFTVQRIVEAHTHSFWAGFLAECAAIALFASASFRWFEQPIRRWMLRKPSS